MTDKTESTVENQTKDDKPWQFKKGQSGNPSGRPLGSKNKLADRFVTALYEDFKVQGVAAIEIVRATDPAAYLRIIASILPKDLNINEKVEFDFSTISDTDLAAIDSLLSQVAVQGRDGEEEGAGTTH